MCVLMYTSPPFHLFPSHFELLAYTKPLRDIRLWIIHRVICFWVRLTLNTAHTEKLGSTNFRARGKMDFLLQNLIFVLHGSSRLLQSSYKKETIINFSWQFRTRNSKRLKSKSLFKFKLLSNQAAQIAYKTYSYVF